MAPQRPRQPSELMPELVEEILIRLPPDDPATLVRASVVCKRWRRILTDPTFRRRYSVFHRAPTLIGFLYDCHTFGGGEGATPRFVSTLTPSPFPHRALVDYDGCRILDCRHGRILFNTSGESVNLVVWDPATGRRQRLPEPRVPCWHYTAAVLCAATVHGCDHVCCHGGPFLVVLAGFDRARNILRSHLYSSEAGAWTASADLPYCNITSRKPSALIGGDLYFVLVPRDMILRYNMSKNCLSIIRSPAEHEVHGGAALVPMEDGSLGFAQALYIQSSTCEVVGAAERFGTIFVATDVGVFTIELKSGRKRKVAEPGEYSAIFSFMSCFYAP
uniref:F-box domain-containing protein n=1 Tax=Setaria italica TaxID=4555 RepID=K3ZZZ8_SETIT